VVYESCFWLGDNMKNKKQLRKYIVKFQKDLDTLLKEVPQYTNEQMLEQLDNFQFSVENIKTLWWSKK
jgi:hypothetical protein